LSTWNESIPDFFIIFPRYTVIGKQLLITNDRNRVCWEVLGLSQDGACIDLFENLRVNSLKVSGDLWNATIFNPPLFSMVNTFKMQIWIRNPGIRTLERDKNHEKEW
jgi:hypothetical protein